jgi:hypothetical protein
MEGPYNETTYELTGPPGNAGILPAFTDPFTLIRRGGLSTGEPLRTSGRGLYPRLLST